MVTLHALCSCRKPKSQPNRRGIAVKNACSLHRLFPIALNNPHKNCHRERRKKSMEY